MRHEMIEVMQDRVRTIYRALTGNELPAPDTEEMKAPDEDITRRFAALEALARGEPRIATRVPPFSFTPEMDAMACADEVVVELALPGVDRDDVSVEIVDGTLVVTGLRRGHEGPEGVTFTCAEIPRGPFHRTLLLPFPTSQPPAVEFDRGLLRIRLRRDAGPGSQ